MLIKPRSRQILGTLDAAGWGERGGRAGKMGAWWAGTPLKGNQWR